MSIRECISIPFLHFHCLFLLVWILFFSSVFIWYCPSVDDKDDTMNAAIYHLKDTYITSMSSNLKLLLEFVLGKRSYALAFTLYFWNNVISILFLLLPLENQMIMSSFSTILMVKQHIYPSHFHIRVDFHVMISSDNPYSYKKKNIQERSCTAHFSWNDIYIFWEILTKLVKYLSWLQKDFPKWR